jgi:ribosomal protein L7/L12
MNSQQLEQINKRLTTLSIQRGKTSFKECPEHARLFDEVYMIARQVVQQVPVEFTDVLYPAQMTLIKSQINAGNRLDAIKSFRDFTGTTLMTSKRMIDIIAENMGKLMAGVAKPRELDRFQTQEIENYLKNGQKLLAVKLYKDYTGSSLMDAKRFIDNWENGQVRKTISKKSPTLVQSLEKALKEQKPRLRHRQAPKAKKRKKAV